MRADSSPPVTTSTPGLATTRIAGVALVVMVLALWLRDGLGLGAAYPWKVALALALGGVALQRGLARSRAPVRFGAANCVTLLRAIVAVLVLSAVGEAHAFQLAATVSAAAAVAAALDGVDGWLARRNNTTSEFGARFDMETDALLVLALAVLAWSWEKAGVWVLLAGAARYLFVLAGSALTWMRRELPPSMRRKAVCAVQVLTLVACVSPWVVPPTSAWLAGCGVVALLLSFALDTAWLARRAGTPGGVLQ